MRKSFASIPGMANGVWMALAAIGLLWPGRLSGPLDGVPLDTFAETVLLGLAFPVLCWFHPQFLADRRVRAAVIALVAWKAGTTALLAQDGLCVRMMPSRPYVRDGTGAPHSWDVRADWRSPDPACSAVMTHAYSKIQEFPVWFFNLPAADGHVPQAEDVPPAATTAMTVRGWITTRSSAVLSVEASPSIAASLRVGDGVAREGSKTIALSAGTHAIAIDASLTGDDWRFRPLLDGEDLWNGASATLSRPSALDAAARPWSRWIAGLLAGSLLAAWLAAALFRVADPWALAWVALAGTALGFGAGHVPEQRWHYLMAALAAAAILPVSRRLKNARGAFFLIVVPWLALVVTINTVEIGQMYFYTTGNDWWTFQRYAYRIFLQGYWLEGGEPTFWFQPFYRWIAGALHMVFGDSSVGEELWDGVGVAVMAMFGFHVVDRLAGFRWGIVAAALVLTSFLAGPGFIFVGHGLAEISSAALIYLAAILAMRSRDGSWAYAVAAGIAATLGTWTRLNNLPMALAVALFAWPLDEPVRTLWRPRAWLARVSRPTLVIVPAVVVAGILLFALRTWHYTGVFSVLHGTQFDAGRGTARRVWQPDMSIGDGLASSLDSLMMVLTTTDPPHLHNGALPLIAGVAVAALAATGIAGLGRLPMALVLFCLASLAGALVSRGNAYPGRFSIHIIGAAIAVFTCALALAVSHAALALKARKRTPLIPT